MSVNQSELKNALANRVANGNVPKAKKPEDTIRELLARMAPEIKRALPKHMDADRLARIAMTTIRITPKLLECNAHSLLASVMQAAQLGLEPGLLGHCYIIPYGKEAQFIIGYRGMIDLARRSGNIESIQAHEVYENDYFVLEYGLQDTLRHIPWHLREDKQFDGPGDFRGCYMVAKFIGGGHHIHYMPKAEIDAHRKRSKAANNGPWVTDYIEMAKKTVVRSAWKWLPISVEIMQKVAASDETVKTEIAPDMGDAPDIIDSTGYVINEAAQEQAAAADAVPAEPSQPNQQGLL
jgi:recombination protein RecT